jgi:hypothetical protein
MDQRTLAQAIHDGLTKFEAEKYLPLEVRRLRIGPGDTLVLRTPNRLSIAAIEHLHAAMRSTFPTAPVIILDDGMDLAVASAETK